MSNIEPTQPSDPCEVCGQPGARCEDPYSKDIDGEIIERVLCQRCFDERADDR